MSIKEITTFLRQLDGNHELDQFLTDENIQGALDREVKDIQKTLVYLSEFGHLKDVTDKLKGLIKDGDSGKATYDGLREPIQKSAKISVDDMLEMYKISSSLFADGNYDEAAAVSSFLSYLNPEISVFWRMTGSCYWKLGNEKAALAPFLYASMVNSLDVNNHLAVLDCLIKLGFSQEALNYYNTAKDVLADGEKWDEIKQLDLKIA